MKNTPIPTDKTVSRMLLIGEKIPYGTYIKHRNIIGSDVTHCFLGLGKKVGDTQIIIIGIYPSLEKPKGFATDHASAGEFYISEEQDIVNLTK